MYDRRKPSIHSPYESLALFAALLSGVVCAFEGFHEDDECQVLSPVAMSLLQKTVSRAKTPHSKSSARGASTNASISRLHGSISRSHGDVPGPQIRIRSPCLSETPDYTGSANPPCCLLDQYSNINTTCIDPQLPRPAPKRKPVMYFHIHKSGGTTMCVQAVEKGERVVQPGLACGSAEFHDYGALGGGDWEVPKEAYVLGDWYVDAVKAYILNYTTCAECNHTCADRVAMFGDEYTWNSIERPLNSGDLCFDDFVYVTIMRETISRLTSQLNYEPFNRSGFVSCLADAVESQNASAYCPQNQIEQPAIIARDLGYVFFDNYVVRMLGGSHTLTLPPGGVNASHFAAAVAVLDRFDLVIPLEELNSERAHAALDSVLGWHPGEEERTRETEHVEHFTEQELESLRSINKFDIALYNHILQKHRW